MPKWLKRSLIVLFWLAVWHLVALLINNDILLASPLKTVWVLLEHLITLGFWSAVGFSMLRIGLGFLIAFVLALSLGALAWRRPLVRDFLNPVITAIKSVPVVCFIVILLIWFGSRWVALLAVFLVAFPALYYSVLQGLDERDKKMQEMLLVFRLSPWRKLLTYYWPSILPFLQAASRTAVGMSWKSGVAAELIGLPRGSIGEHIYSAKIMLMSADVFAWTAVVVALSLLAEKFFLWLLTRSTDWSWKLALPRQMVESSRKAALEIRCQDLNKAFADQTVLAAFSAVISPGSRSVLNAPSGEGKTTLLRIFAGLEKLDGGVVVNRNRVSMVFQEARLFEGRSALDNIRLLVGHNVSESEIQATLSSVLPEESLKLPAGQLSGGMQRRLELCRALLAPSQLLLLDEPFTGLDADNLRQTRQLVLSLQAARTIILASHEQTDVSALQATVILL